MGAPTLTAFFGVVPCLVGCTATFSRLPTLDYQSPQAQVELRFDGEPVDVVFSDANDDSERELARCHVACRVTMPSGEYRLRTLGDAPEVEETFTLHQHTRIVVSPGDSTQRAGGIVLEAAGALAFGVGTLYAIPLRDSLEKQSSAPPILGISGLLVLATGVLIHQVSRTRVRIEDVEDPPPAAAGFDGAVFRF